MQIIKDFSNCISWIHTWRKSKLEKGFAEYTTHAFDVPTFTSSDVNITW